MSFIKVVVNGYDETSGDMKNIFYFNQNANEASIVAFIRSGVYDQIGPHLHPDFHIENVSIHTWEGPASGEWYETDANGKKVAKKLPPWGVGRTMSFGSEFVGTSAAPEKLPPQVAPYLFYSTDKPHAIGKKYFGDFTSDALEGGQFAVAVLAHLEQIATNIRNGLDGTGIISWGPIYGFQQIRSCNVGRYLGTQRRRKPGRGS